MKTRLQIMHTITQRLEEAEAELSDEAYEYLNSYEDIGDVMVYQYALKDYLLILKDRFWCDPEDDNDEVIIKRMLFLINALINMTIKD